MLENKLGKVKRNVRFNKFITSKTCFEKLRIFNLDHPWYPPIYGCLWIDVCVTFCIHTCTAGIDAWISLWIFTNQNRCIVIIMISALQ